MTIQLLLAFITFAFVMSVTPGPNNMMLLASGVNFGLRRSLPHLLGISLGLMLMVCAMGFGLGQLLKLYPPLFNILRYVGGAYLLYLSWRIATAAAPQVDGAADAKPFGLLQAAAFQWVNPKAWIMAVAAITNGREWRFFTDLNQKNIMDDKPFLVLHLDSPDDNTAEQLAAQTLTMTGDATGMVATAVVGVVV